MSPKSTRNQKSSGQPSAKSRLVPAIDRDRRRDGEIPPVQPAAQRSKIDIESGENAEKRSEIAVLPGENAEKRFEIAVLPVESAKNRSEIDIHAGENAEKREKIAVLPGENAEKRYEIAVQPGENAQKQEIIPVQQGENAEKRSEIAVQLDENAERQEIIPEQQGENAQKRSEIAVQPVESAEKQEIIPVQQGENAEKRFEIAVQPVENAKKRSEIEIRLGENSAQSAQGDRANSIQSSNDTHSQDSAQQLPFKPIVSQKNDGRVSNTDQHNGDSAGGSMKQPMNTPKTDAQGSMMQPMNSQETDAQPLDEVRVVGAREHNLRDIQVRFRRDQLVVITGLSGSGKSSLAFQTLYAEGQRRYMESFSAYARQFIGAMERPDVDVIEGLSPVISIEQKTVGRNPRSTVGTVTEVYDFFRLLYARVGEAVSYHTGKVMQRLTEEEIRRVIANDYEGKSIVLLAPLIRSRKGHYKELFEQLKRLGFMRVRVDGEFLELKAGMQVNRYKTHEIELQVDKLKVSEGGGKRLSESLTLALRQGKGVVLVWEEERSAGRYFSRFLMDPESGVAYDEPQPNTFSFNSPQGACPHCDGLGSIAVIDPELLMPDPTLSIIAGGIAPLGEYREIWIFRLITELARKYKAALSTPVGQLEDGFKKALLYGSDALLEVAGRYGEYGKSMVRFEGIIPMLQKQRDDSNGTSFQSWAEEYLQFQTCSECKGARLKNESLHFLVAGKNIAQAAAMELTDLSNWLAGLENGFAGQKALVAAEILREIRTRVSFLLGIGLGYLSLDRPAKSLSGGESQRIRLATQLGSQLVGVMYILDEPSIGLHQRDNLKLIESLKALRDSGNTVLVVEHDEEIIRQSDYVIDLGPGAGRYGGEVVGCGHPDRFIHMDTLTAAYLRGEKSMPFRPTRMPGDKWISMYGVSGNNLKNVDVRFPLGSLICVTGVSGSGKSTLIHENLFPLLSQKLTVSRRRPLGVESVEGVEYIDKVIEVDQAPIGRTPRSNPSTYTGVFSDIRQLFAEMPEAKIRGYKPGRFSFNVKGGRCETCGGAGMRIVEMNFLPDVEVRCEECGGRRYNRETLEVRYKGKSISEVLDMSISEALAFFENIPAINRKIQTLQEVGLGYLTLGQSSTTLSGGEAQRVKLAAELSRRDTGNTFYILDEPTTGLHFEDIRVLMEVLHRLVERGNTVLIIEHNLDVIRSADYLIDLGPEGGKAGGRVLYAGPRDGLRNVAESHTARYLMI